MGDVIILVALHSDEARASARFPDIQFDWVVEEGFAEIPAWLTGGGRSYSRCGSIGRWRASTICQTGASVCEWDTRVKDTLSPPALWI